MLAWLKYWFSKSESQSSPKPPPITTIEVHPRNLYPYTRYTMTPATSPRMVGTNPATGSPPRAS